MSNKKNTKIQNDSINKESKKLCLDNIKTDISQIEVQAIFEIGRANIPLLDIDNLANGYTFVLENKIDNSVNITVNDKCIAKGIIVQVNDNIGVKIAKVFI